MAIKPVRHGMAAIAADYYAIGAQDAADLCWPAPPAPDDVAADWPDGRAYNIARLAYRNGYAAVCAIEV